MNLQFHGTLLASPDSNFDIAHQFNQNTDRTLFSELQHAFPLDRHAFQTTLLMFETKELIRNDTFSQLEVLFGKYGRIANHNEQPLMNLYFINIWQPFPAHAMDGLGLYAFVPEDNKELGQYVMVKYKSWWDFDNRHGGDGKLDLYNFLTNSPNMTAAAKSEDGMNYVMQQFELQKK